MNWCSHSIAPNVPRVCVGRFIIRNREILQSGKFKIQPQQNGQYNIETTPEEFKIDGLLYVCNKHTAYHPKTKTIWHFYCNCFIK
jgi:hypothetical protein